MSTRDWFVRTLRSRTGLLQWVLLLGAVGFVAWIIVDRKDDLQQALQLTPQIFIYISVSSLITFALNGIELQVLAGRFGPRIPFRESLMLGLLVSTLNYLPMKTGTVLNGVLMRARYKLQLSHFTALIAGSNVIHLSTGITMAGIALLLGPQQHHGWGWLFVLGPTALISLLIIWGRRRTFGRHEAHRSRLVRIGFRVIDGVGQIFSDARLFTIEVAINVSLISLWAFRSYWSFRAIGVNASFGSVLTVTALSILFSRLSIIPGGVGFREAGAAFGSAITGLSAEAGFAATVIGRAVELIWLIIVGVPATVYLLRSTGVGLSDALRDPREFAGEAEDAG